MAQFHWILFSLSLVCLARGLDASAGDADPIYQACMEHCEKTGCAGGKCFQHCKFSSDGKPIDGPWYRQEPLYLEWKQWDCHNDCRYQCMLDREEERQKLGDKPVKYHGKWPFRRLYGIQEPVSVALSALNLAIQFHGWVSFFILIDCRDVEFTEKLDYSSAVALLGFTFILAILRAFSIRDEAARVMVAAPVIAFLTTHIMYLNFYNLDYGLNLKVCTAMGIAQLLIWAVWAGITGHPSRWKLWVVVVGGGLAMLLEIYDFPPYHGFVDAHALWHASTIPFAYLWWRFVRDDAEFRTSCLLKKTK
eukprot:XP_015577980.1 post-GPI attachment to proteins factor 3 [Ricinus communis]